MNYNTYYYYKGVMNMDKKEYYKRQLQKLVNSEYGFTMKIVDSENNSPIVGQ